MRVVGKQAMTYIVRQRQALVWARHPAACHKRNTGARQRRSPMVSGGAQGIKTQLRATLVTGTLTACQVGQ